MYMLYTYVAYRSVGIFPDYCLLPKPTHRYRHGCITTYAQLLLSCFLLDHGAWEAQGGCSDTAIYRYFNTSTYYYIFYMHAHWRKT